MLILILLSASALIAQEQGPPPAASRLLDAIEASDIGAARGTLSPDVMIMSEEGEDEAKASTLENLARFVRGCRRGEVTTDVDAEDPSRTAVTATWTCPSRSDAQAFVWTDSTGVVHIQFGPAPAP